MRDPFIFAKVDVNLREHARAYAAGQAMGTWLWALLMTRAQLQDGLVTAKQLRGAWAGARQAAADMRALVKVGLAEVVDPASLAESPELDANSLQSLRELSMNSELYRLKGYAKKNETREEVEKNRERTRERKAKSRGKPDGVTRDMPVTGHVTDVSGHASVTRRSQRIEQEQEQEREISDPPKPPAPRPAPKAPPPPPKSTAPQSTAEEDLDRLLDGTGTARRPRDAQASFQVLDGHGSPPRSKTPPQADSVAARPKAKRGPTASELAYLEAYRRGVVTGSGSNVVYTAEHMTLRPLVAIAQAHCRGLIGDALKDELERIGEAYARAVGKSQFHLGFKPGRCLDWLNSGRPNEAQRAAQRDPDRGIQKPMAAPLETNIPEHLRRKANP